MSLVVLPRRNEPNASAEARRRLESAIEDPLTVVMIVCGDDPDVQRVLEICVARASVKAQIRRVVWIPDSSVLSSDLKRRVTRSGRAAVAIGLEDKVAASLTKLQGKVGIRVERAFLAAESQE